MADTTDNAQAPARDTAGARLAAKRAAKAAKKAAARGTEQPGAEVAKQVTWATSWFDQHKAKAAIAVAAIALALVGWFAYARHASGVDREAGALLHTAFTTSQGYVTTGDEPAPEDLLVPTFASAEERDKKALAQFLDVEKKFPGTHAARWAKLGEANAELALGKYADATKSYGDVVANAESDDTFLQARALEGLGFALESDKKEADAIKRFEELAKLDNGSYRTLADYQRARVLAKTGKRDEATKVLEALLKAAADKPAAGEGAAPDQGEKYPSVISNAETLLTELGGKPPAKAGQAVDLSSLGIGGGSSSGDKNALTQQVMEALRKQMAEKKSNGK